MLKVEKIVKKFTNDAMPVIDNLNLQLEQGDFCMLIGSNGSGKSTLLKALSGEFSIDSGGVFLNKQDITLLPIHERAKYISSVSQNMTKGTISEMTLTENLILGRLRGENASLKNVKHHYANLQNMVSALDPMLEGLLQKPLSTLSGGQRQKVATLMATFNEPLLLLLDEHCSALDPKSQAMVMAFTANMIQKLGTTALMVTHDLTDAITYGNRLIMLKQGKIAYDFDQQAKKSLTVSELRELFHD